MKLSFGFAEFTVTRSSFSTLLYTLLTVRDLISSEAKTKKEEEISARKQFLKSMSALPEPTANETADC